MIKTIPRVEGNSRERLTASKVIRFLTLPFYPKYLKPWMAVNRFEDIPIEALLKNGLEGVLLDADGTLGSHHSKKFPDSVVQHVLSMKAMGLQVAIYTNSSEDRFQQFEGIEVVREAQPKPDRRGFETAMKNHLHLDDPARVCMIGDNLITDGGAIAAGMRFIYVHPVPGKEGFWHSAFRYIAYFLAKWYFPARFKNLNS